MGVSDGSRGILPNGREPGVAADRAASAVVDAAIRVHKALGPGLLESVYAACLAHELRLRGLRVSTEVTLPIHYRGLEVPAGLRMDLLVEDSVVVELKAVEHLLPVHEAQLLSYLKLSGHPLGLLLNFHVAAMKDGIRRRVLSS